MWGITDDSTASPIASWRVYSGLSLLVLGAGLFVFSLSEMLFSWMDITQWTSLAMLDYPTLGVACLSAGALFVARGIGGAVRWSLLTISIPLVAYVGSFLSVVLLIIAAGGPYAPTDPPGPYWLYYAPVYLYFAVVSTLASRRILHALAASKDSIAMRVRT